MGTRIAPTMCASILGAMALLCLEGPAVVLSRHGDDADTHAQSVTQPGAEIADPAHHADEPPPAQRTANGHRRPFNRPPGHRVRPARDVAPGHVRAHGGPPVREDPTPPPAGDILGATPQPGPRTAPTPSRTDPRHTGSELGAAGFAAATGVAASSWGALADGSQRAGALGAALGVAAAFSPAYGHLATPPVTDRLGPTLLLLVLCSQVLAAALLSCAVPQILGAFGPPRAR